MILNSIVNDFIEIKSKKSLPSWLNNKNITSIIYTSENFYKIRISELKIDKKIYAESLVIYPNLHYESPIFGTEYVNIANKIYFGAIDFHPLKSDLEYQKKYINPYLNEFPNRKKDKSKFYNLNIFFSKKLWLRKQKNNIIDEYKIMVKCYLYQYLKCIDNSIKLTSSFEEEHKHFNKHLGKTDPVIGILKSNFDENFAKKYLKEFLFAY